MNINLEIKVKGSGKDFRAFCNHERCITWLDLTLKNKKISVRLIFLEHQKKKNCERRMKVQIIPYKLPVYDFKLKKVDTMAP